VAHYYVIHSNKTYWETNEHDLSKKRSCNAPTKNIMVNGGKSSLEIKIVGSIADKDEVHLIKNITEVFLIEQRIRSLLDENGEEGVSMISV
jgi:hypothetical protein